MTTLPSPALRPQFAYGAIAESLRTDIRAGRLVPGGTLPAERTLAARFGVNRQTVRAALDLLRRERLIATGKRGSIVTMPAHPPTWASPAGGVPTPGPAVPSTSGPPAPSRATTARTSAAAATSTVTATGAVGTAAPPPPAAHLPAPGAVRFPGGPFTAGAQRTAAWLSLASVPPSLAAELGLAPGERTLIHHHRATDASGRTLQAATTYFTPTAVAAVGELGRYARALRPHQPDLSLLYEWMRREGLHPGVRETLTLSRPDRPSPAASRSWTGTATRADTGTAMSTGTDVTRGVQQDGPFAATGTGTGTGSDAPAAEPAPTVEVRRHTHDQYGRLLEITHFTPTAPFTRLTLPLDSTRAPETV